MDNLLPPSASSLERAAAQVLSQIGRLDVPLRDLWNPQTCPIDLLPWLAWTVAVNDWNENWPEATKRQVVTDQVPLHRTRGTAWSVKRAVQQSGLTAEIIERAQQRQIYEAAGAIRLDGSWRLDGSRAVRPVDIVTGVPQIQSWAQFIVRLDLAQAERPDTIEHARRLIEAWKPTRSWPIYSYVLRLLLLIDVGIRSNALMRKSISGRYPWCGRVISPHPGASWKLGKHAEPVRLPLPFGSFRVGETRGAVSRWRLRGCRIDSHALVGIAGPAAQAGQIVRLGDPDVRLDGSWQLNRKRIWTTSAAQIEKNITLDGSVARILTHHESCDLLYPGSRPRLASPTNRLASWVRLDGSWGIGSPRRSRPFGFSMGRDGTIVTDATSTIRIHGATRTSPERLSRLRAIKLARTPRKIDGSWQLGARRMTTGPRIGHFAVSYEIPGADQYEQWDGRARRRLDGAWQIGGPAAPVSTLTIKEATHG